MSTPSPFRFMNEGVPPFDRKEFVDAFHHAYKAVMFGGNPFPDPKKKGFVLEHEDGSATAYRFTDNSLNRAGFAITRRYAGNPEKAQVFLIRYLALFSIWKDKRSEKWRRKCPDGTEDLNEAIIHAAAISPVNKNLEFDLDRYFENVEKIASEDDDV